MINKRVLMIFILHDLPPFETNLHTNSNQCRAQIYKSLKMLNLPKYTKVDGHEH